MFASAKEEDGSVYSSDVRVEDKYVDWHRKKKKPSAMNIVSSKERETTPPCNAGHARTKPTCNYIYKLIYRHTTGDWKMLRRIFLSTLDFSEKQQHMAKNKIKKKKKKNFQPRPFCNLLSF